MRAQVAKNADGGYKVLLVPENDVDRYNLDRGLEKYLRTNGLTAEIDVLTPMSDQCSITLVGTENDATKRRGTDHA